MDFDRAVAELDALVATLERESDERALHLLELIDAIHRPALERLAAGDADDEAARAVLAMYGLREVDPHVLAEEGLDRVRPYIESHGGSVELLEVADGVVHVRMAGSCHGCAASAMTLKRGIEEALRESYPAFREVVAHEPEGRASGPQLIQLEGVEELRRPRFAAVGDSMPEPGAMRAAEVEGISVLLLNLEGEVYALRNACPVDGRPLDGGRLSEDGVIVCPWHNCAYDARSGSRLDGAGDGVAVIPVAGGEGVPRVAVNVL